MNYSLFRECSDPFSYSAGQQRQTYFKDAKVLEASSGKKKVGSLTWDLTGSKLATGSGDGYIRLFTTDFQASLKKVQEFKSNQDCIQDIAWHPTRESVFFTTSKDKQIKMWDLNVKGGGSSGSGSIAASSGNQTGSTQQTLTAQHIEKTKEPNLFLAVSPDGTYLGVSNERDELSIYDMRTWRIFKQIKYKVNINGFSWDKADGRLFLVGDQTGTVSVFNGETFSNQPLHEMKNCHHGHCYDVVVDNSNRFFVTAGADSLIGMWDMADFSQIKTISNNDSRVMAVSLNHDSTLVASISEDDSKTKPQYFIEVYDLNCDDKFSQKSQTLFSKEYSSQKECLSWNPKRNVLAYSGESEGGMVVHLVNPLQSSTPLVSAYDGFGGPHSSVSLAQLLQAQ